MNLKKTMLALGLFLSALNFSQAVVLTNFSTPDDFTVVEIGIPFTTITANPDNVTVDGTDNNESLGGTFNPVDTSGLSVITLTGILSGVNPNSDFSIYLFNSTLTESRLYTGNTSSFGELTATLTLTFVDETAAFDDIAGFQFVGGGIGSSLNFTFQSLSAEAVPEPSTWVLLIAGVLVGGFSLQRRRQRI